ncbi:ParB/RepB/Spo0J family partition protein [Treponema sp. TIM-1]|uniref:ParB/RepB/Spo0J family partition protein n=1 Tax=Treponema sp. TIM-1 TaxID=2898417 RepID=UPI00397F0B44
MPPKYGLGKGLDALIPREEEFQFQESSPGKGETFLALDKIRANPNQPRKNFEEESLKELADSIRSQGIIQPIIVEDAGDGTYTIVAGERRSRAAHLAGLREVPVLIRSYSDEKRLEVAIIENVQRTDLNPIEEAAAYKKLMEITGLSQDEVAAKVGKNRSTVANALRLLKLPGSVQKSLETGKISAGHARAILSVSTPKGQALLFEEILARNYSVREAESRSASLNEGTPKTAAKVKPIKKQDPELTAMEQRFIEALGTKVSITGDFNRGCIQIDYYSMDDLDRLYEILNP